jgi:hypothetical protein
MNEYLQKFRAQYPEYGDMSDADLAKALHAKYYMDMSFPEFAKQIGFDLKATAEDAALDRVAASGNAVTDFLHQAAEGATLSFADKIAGVGAAVIPGGKGYREAASDFQQRSDDLRLLNPSASNMANAAGFVGGTTALRGLGAAVGAIRSARGVTPMGALPAEYGSTVPMMSPVARRTAMEALRGLVKPAAREIGRVLPWGGMGYLLRGHGGDR